MKTEVQAVWLVPVVAMGLVAMGCNGVCVVVMGLVGGVGVHVLSSLCQVSLYFLWPS